MKLIAETFEADQRPIGEFARTSAANMADVYRFVLATIQQPLSSTPMIVQDFKRRGSASTFAFGPKRAALDWLSQNETWVYDVAMATYDSSGDVGLVEERLMLFFSGLPGLGLVKAGFMVQLCFGLGGCLDTHNIDRFGLNASSFKASSFKDAKREATRIRLVRSYLETVRQCGGCAQLWAEWCQYVANKTPRFEGDAVVVSRLHRVALGLVEAA